MLKKVDAKLIRRTIADCGKVLVSLLDEIAVVAGLILVFHLLGLRIPLPITITLGIIFGIYVFILFRSVIPSFHKKQVAGQERMVGIQGRVVEPLTPVGTIMVKGEYWRAESLDDNIEVDKDVEIVGRERLMLTVKRKIR